MNMKVLAGSLVAVALIGAGCSQAGDPNSQTAKPVQTQPTVSNPTPQTEGAGHGGEHLATLAGSRIDLENKNSLKPGEVTFRFKLYGLDGHEFGDKDLAVVHEKKMHFLLVRDDMTGFQHLHPEYKNEKWEVATRVPEAGNYQLYVDVDPTEEEAIVLRVPVSIGGATANANAPTPNADVSAVDGNYKVVLTSEGTVKTNEHTKLTFMVQQNGKAVSTIDPYLGAYGHVVLLRHTDPDDFYHVHPLTETKPADGKVQFEAQFPVKGRYTLYAQFNVNGSVRTFPITIDVSEAGTDTDTSHGHGEVMMIGNTDAGAHNSGH